MSWTSKNKEECPHLKEMKLDTTGKKKCENCEYTTELRLCTTCGYVGCCESDNAHDTEHYNKTKHPIIKRLEKDNEWLYCYACEAFLK